MSLGRALFNFLFNLLLLPGLMVLGWGLDHPGGLLAHPVRLTVCILLAVYTLARSTLSVALGLEALHPDRHAGWYRLHLLLMEAVLLLAPFTDRNAILPMPEAARWVGLIVTVLGAGLGLWAQSAWLRVKKRRPRALVTTGPYRRVRHPRLLNALLIAGGVALTFAAGLALALVVPLAGVTLVLIRAEEHSLEEERGEEFADYRRRSWRLIPYLY